MQKLEWDSNFWDIDMFHLDVSNEIEIKLPDKKNFIIQSLCELSDNSFINMLEREGFLFKESKITLSKTNINNKNINNLNYRKFSFEDLKIVENNCFELFGKNSRFNIFPDEKVNEFYYTWFKNSIFGEMDDACIGYFDDNNLAGFVTYRIRGPRVSIGLLGVLPDSQGQGISQLLLSYIDNIAMENTMEIVSISTQGTNINALNAYIKNGYRIQSIKHWYYYIKGETK